MLQSLLQLQLQCTPPVSKQHPLLYNSHLGYELDQIGGGGTSDAGPDRQQKRPAKGVVSFILFQVQSQLAPSTMLQLSRKRRH